MNLDNVHGEKKDFLKALTKPVTKLVIQLDKKVLEKIALGQTEYAEKSLIKVSILLQKDLIFFNGKQENHEGFFSLIPCIFHL